MCASGPNQLAQQPEPWGSGRPAQGHQAAEHWSYSRSGQRQGYGLSNGQEAPEANQTPRGAVR